MAKTVDQLDQDLVAIRAKITEMFAAIMTQLADQIELPAEDHA